MAKGYSLDDPDEENGIPRRPARRADSYRAGGGAQENYGYTSSSYGTAPRASYPADILQRSASPRPGSSNYTGGHYAESPILMPAGSEKNLSLVPPSAAPRQHRSQGRTRSKNDLRRTSSEGPPGGDGKLVSSASATLPTASGRTTRQSQRNNTISKVRRRFLGLTCVH